MLAAAHTDIKIDCEEETIDQLVISPSNLQAILSLYSDHIAIKIECKQGSNQQHLKATVLQQYSDHGAVKIDCKEETTFPR
jgi:sporulation protein YlmC with PRC-barrel domain